MISATLGFFGAYRPRLPKISMRSNCAIFLVNSIAVPVRDDTGTRKYE